MLNPLGSSESAGLRVWGSFEDLMKLNVDIESTEVVLDRGAFCIADLILRIF